jgi:hypothetical protein
MLVPWKKTSKKRHWGGAESLNANRALPRVEHLEDRMAPAVYTVTAGTDLNPGGGGFGTGLTGDLRYCMTQAEATAGNTVQFAIPGAGVRTIQLATDLPVLNADPIVIDGTTQPGYLGSPLIVLDGTNAGAAVDGLDIQAGNTTVRGLCINSFTGSGIYLETRGGDTVQACYIGTDATGTVAKPNATSGITIDSSNNTIGGAYPVGGNNSIGGANAGNNSIGGATGEEALGSGT